MPAKRKTAPVQPSAAKTPARDPVTQYALDVVEGRDVAGPHVRNACKRHLKDLETGHERGLTFDLDAVNRVIGFFSQVLKLTGGNFEGQPFLPTPFQQFILGSLFGWKGADGYRRFRVAFIESGKGSGKSPLAAGIGLYLMTSDSEARAEIYAGAAKKEQGQILFRDAVAMVRQSPALMQRLTFSGGPGREWNIAYLNTGSFFRVISSDQSQSGARPHGGILDEIHEHKDDNVVEMMRAGTKGRRQALILMITNSGVDRTSVCYNYHDYGAKVAAGDLIDDTFFSYICALDEGDDPLEDEEAYAARTGGNLARDVWRKSNPNLGITIQESYLREQVTQARGMPSKESIVRRLNFSEWVDASAPWISGDLWRAAEADFDLDELEGEPCYGGLDLSGVKDLTALALAFPREGGRIDLVTWFWTPEETVTERARQDRVPYDAWIRSGHLHATPGRAVDYRYVTQFLGDLAARFDIQQLAYDPYRIAYFQTAMDEDGLDIPLVAHGQGYFKAAQTGLWMPRSVDLLESAVLEGRLRVLKNPVLTWNSASAVLSMDPKGNRVFDKRRAAGRIDGIVAGAMSIGCADQADDGADLSEFFLDPIIV